MSVVNRVLNKLGTREGVGDKVARVKTGAYGVTEAARRAIRPSGDLTDREVAERYLKALYAKWETVRGYENSPVGVQEALLDCSYNLGPSVMLYEGVVKGLYEGDYRRVGEAILSSANVGGKSSRGLGKRRAEVYNLMFDGAIQYVRQYEDGTLAYLGEDGKTIYKYTSTKGRHETSSIGVLTV